MAGVQSSFKARNGRSSVCQTGSRRASRTPTPTTVTANRPAKMSATRAERSSPSTKASSATTSTKARSKNSSSHRGRPVALVRAQSQPTRRAGLGQRSSHAREGGRRHPGSPTHSGRAPSCHRRRRGARSEPPPVGGALPWAPEQRSSRAARCSSSKRTRRIAQLRAATPLSRRGGRGALGLA